MKTSISNQIVLKSKKEKMKTKKSFILMLMIVVLTTSLYSCLEDVGNKQSFSAIPSYINETYTVLETAIPDLHRIYISGVPPSVDSYGFASFEVDFDNQKANDYTTATYLSWANVKDYPISPESGNMKDSYSATISEAGIYPYSSLLVNGHLFFEMKLKMPSDRKYNYKLVYNIDSTDVSQIPELYLKATVAYPGSGSETEIFDYCAFDFRYLMSTAHAKDTLDYYRMVRFNMKYQTGNTQDGSPIFKSLGNSIPIFMPKN